ncbi:MAG: enoyl-CoA hydratase-related protein [Paracoccaceae bacterium]
MTDATLYALAGRVAVITLNRPSLMNALNAGMRRGVVAGLERAAAEGARVVVLTGAGAGFCSGQDVSDPSLADPRRIGEVLHREYEPMLAAIRDCPVPVIAAVNGVAAGAGANLALGCDVVIAAESAQFIQAFARIGLMPDAGGTWWLPRQVGHARALGAALFAEPVGARQAADWGMIWEAVPDADFAARWQARAQALAEGPTRAYREIRLALREAWARDLPAQLAAEAEGQARLGASADLREGVAAFLGKRRPRFTGT